MGRGIKKLLAVVGVLVGTVVIGAGGYVGYVILSYNRIGDIDLEVDKGSSRTSVSIGTTYSAMTYNIGFGAYSQDYTFFLDTGYDDEGNPTCGRWSKGKSKDEVLFNTEGAIEVANSLNADFNLFQEVDYDSTRSYHINQDEMIREAFPKYDHVQAVNYHMPFLPYPLYDMHGYTGAGITTMSRYAIEEAKRIEYPVSDGFGKFIDLDRCFSISKIKVSNGKPFYLVNSHMSAYDEGGTVREQQVKKINDFLAQAKEEGAYVIMGGDWNHELLINNPEFSYNDANIPFGMTKKTPDWLQRFFSEDGSLPFVEGYRIVASDNAPTCRNNDIEWDPSETYQCVVDGFIVSDNIHISAHRNIVTTGGNKGYSGFSFADHEPAYIEFSLL